MNLVKHLLTESIRRGNLYHYTKLRNLRSILLDNELKPSDNNHTIPSNGYVSLSRNHMVTDLGYTRITLDGDKIYNDYKIEPYYDNDDLFHGERDSYRHPIRDLEREERIKGSIKNLGRYIIQIDILKKSPFGEKNPEEKIVEDDIYELISEEKINIVTKWEPVK